VLPTHIQDFVRQLGEWAVEGLATAPLPGDPPPGSHEELLQEGRQVYALGKGGPGGC
jgi:hypothetical protein